LIIVAARDGAEGRARGRAVIYVLMDCERHEGGEPKGAYWTAEMAIDEAKKHPNSPNSVSFWEVVEIPIARPADYHETVWSELRHD
jgi:hypothetical protein